MDGPAAQQSTILYNTIQYIGRIREPGEFQEVLERKNKQTPVTDEYVGLPAFYYSKFDLFITITVIIITSSSLV